MKQEHDRILEVGAAAGCPGKSKESADMASYVVERRRTGWDIGLGVLLVVAGFIVLGHTAMVTTVSVLFLGWLALLSGIVAIVAAMFRIGKDGFWSIALTGALLIVIGLMFVRHTAAAALTLTLLIGALFLSAGIIRLIGSFEYREDRWILLLGGLVSTVLGLIVLFNLVAATYTLLGILLGIQLLVDGLTVMVVGRGRVQTKPVTSGTA
jgi:uncharacterized membrane protein HdeD (DUF308 family)